MLNLSPINLKETAGSAAHTTEQPPVVDKPTPANTKLASKIDLNSNGNLGLANSKCWIG